MIPFSYWFDKPWFLIEGRLTYCAQLTLHLGFPNGSVEGNQDSFLAPFPGRKKTIVRGVSHIQSLYFVIVLLANHAFYQWLIPLKLDLIGKVGSRKNKKKIMRNTACHKKGNTYGNKLINCISLLETCALLIMLLIALINLVAVGGINILM